MDFSAALCVAIIVSLLVALIVCLVMRSKMKTAKIARSADNYIPPNGFVLAVKVDSFLYRTTSRRKIERSSSK